MDSAPTLKAWAASLGGLSFPLLSDFHPKAAVLQQLGLYNDERGIARRSVTIGDKEGMVRWHQVYQPGSLPDPKAVLAELDNIRQGAALDP